MRVKWSRRAPALFPNKVQTSETVPLRLAASHTNNTVCATCKDGTYSNVTDYYSPCQQHTRSEPPPYTCVTPASATLSVFCFWSFQTYPRGTKISLIQYSAIVCLGYKHVWLFAGARPWGESWTSQERPKETQCVATSNLVGFFVFLPPNMILKFQLRLETLEIWMTQRAAAPLLLGFIQLFFLRRFIDILKT